MNWSYFLNFKSEAFENFRKFKALVEKQTCCNIKTLHTDRGGELLYNNFTLFFSREWIYRNLTTPYSSQQNLVVGQKNHIVVKMSRS